MSIPFDPAAIPWDLITKVVGVLAAMTITLEAFRRMEGRPKVEKRD